MFSTEVPFDAETHRKAQKLLDAHTSLENDHLVWKGHKTHTGGVGRVSMEGKHLFAYNLAWKLHCGQFCPEDCIMKRMCESKLCVSPKHFILVSKSVGTVWKDGDFQYVRKRIEQNSTVQANGCMIWSKSIDRSGNGKFQYGKCRYQLAHMYAWIVHARDPLIPTGMSVCHACGTRACCAPSHMRLGDASSNMKDKVKDGTSLHGRNTKVSEDIARAIKNSKDEMTVPERAEKFGVSTRYIRGIDTGHSFNWLGRTPEEDDKTKTTTAKRTAKTILTTPEQFDAALQRIRDNSTNENHFTKHVQTPCWIWKKFINTAGYGNVGYLGDQTQAHILSYRAFNRMTAIESNLVVRHKCMMKACCNPEHLELGTRKENSQDRKRDGTVVRNSKLTLPEVLNIRESKGTGTQTERSKRFGVSFSVVAHIDDGSTWKELDSLLNMEQSDESLRKRARIS